MATGPAEYGESMHARRFAIYGGLFGLSFPIIGTVIEAFTRGYGLAPAGLARAQVASPLLWIIDTAPFFLAVLAFVAGRSQDHVVGVDDARREGYNKTASELFTAAGAALHRLVVLVDDRRDGRVGPRDD